MTVFIAVVTGATDGVGRAYAEAVRIPSSFICFHCALCTFITVYSHLLDLVNFTIYSSDAQLAARGPDPARDLIYSGPRQVSGLF
jgi:hypothetical protein